MYGPHICFEQYRKQQETSQQNIHKIIYVETHEYTSLQKNRISTKYFLITFAHRRRCHRFDRNSIEHYDFQFG